MLKHLNLCIVAFPSPEWCAILFGDHRVEASLVHCVLYGWSNLSKVNMEPWRSGWAVFGFASHMDFLVPVWNPGLGIYKKLPTDISHIYAWNIDDLAPFVAFRRLTKSEETLCISEDSTNFNMIMNRTMHTGFSTETISMRFAVAHTKALCWEIHKLYLYIVELSIG